MKIRQIEELMGELEHQAGRHSRMSAYHYQPIITVSEMDYLCEEFGYNPEDGRVVEKLVEGDWITTSGGYVFYGGRDNPVLHRLS